jgi:lipoprotein signal peptidase
LNLKNLASKLSFIIFLVLLDLSSKFYIRYFNIQEIEIINGILTIDLTYNTGIAFGFLSDYTEITYFFSLVVFIWLIIQFKNSASSNFELIGLLLIISGAIGNLSERGWNLIFNNNGKVTDFIELLFIPSFNFADMYISFGITIFLFMEFKNK